MNLPNVSNKVLARIALFSAEQTARYGLEALRIFDYSYICGFRESSIAMDKLLALMLKALRNGVYVALLLENVNDDIFSCVDLLEQHQTRSNFLNKIPLVMGLDFDSLEMGEVEAVQRIIKYIEKSFFPLVVYVKFTSLENSKLIHFLKDPVVNYDSVLKFYSRTQETQGTQSNGHEIHFRPLQNQRYAYSENLFVALQSRVNCDKTVDVGQIRALATDASKDRQELLHVNTLKDWLFKGVILNFSYKCTGSCQHCFLSCGPDKSERLDVSLVKQFFDEMRECQSIAKFIVIAGGEPTLFWEDLLEIISYARDCGFDTMLGTNGHWAMDYESTLPLCVELNEAGLSMCQLSCDRFHQRHVPITSVANAIKALKKVGIKTILRVTTDPRGTVQAAINDLPLSALQGVEVVISRILYLGRAKSMKRHQIHFQAASGYPRGSCFARLIFTIKPNGDVYPCSTGSELCSSLRIGNLYEGSLEQIISGLSSNKTLYALTRLGPSFFARMLTNTLQMKQVVANTGYGSICELCNEIFSSTELVETARRISSETKLNDYIPVLLREYLGKEE